MVNGTEAFDLRFKLHDAMCRYNRLAGHGVLKLDDVVALLKLAKSIFSLNGFGSRNFLPIIAEKVHQEKVQQEKLKAIKARLNFEEASQHSELVTPSRRRDLKKRLGSRHVRNMSGSPEPRRGHSESPRKRDPKRKTVFKRLENGVFHMLEDKGKSISAYSNDSRRRSYHSSRRDTESYYQSSHSRETEFASENIITKEHPYEGWKRCQKVKVAQEDIGSQSQRDKIRVLRMTCPNHGYDDLKKAFLENYLQQKKCIKDLVEIHNIKQRDRESTVEFVQRYKLECKDVKGATKCMKIYRFMYRIRNPQLIKRLHDKILKSVDEMMRKQNFKKGGFQNQQRSERKQDRFTLITKTPKEILALDKVKFKPPPPMTTPVEKRDATKFCEFDGEVGHTTDKCMHLKRQIEELFKAGKLLHLIKELKQNNGKNQAKAVKKGETSGKDKLLAILMDGTKGPMIIEDEMGGHFVHRMYVDGGSSLEILYEHSFNRFCPEIGDGEHSTPAWMSFMVLRSPYPYNGIIGRPGVRIIQAVPSTAHGMLKFPLTGRTVTLWSSMIIPLECTMVSGPGVSRPVINQVTEEKIQVAIHPEYPEQTVAIGSTLIEEGRKELCGLLRRNLDIFAWKPADIIGVPRHISEHRLNIREGCLPVRQKKRGQAPERNKAIYEEVEKLVDAGIMKEVHYYSWLSNPAMVKKHDGSWRMCVDFKDLNKACPKDGYSLSEIDWKAESLCGYPFKCFLDAYKGYPQIKTAKEDEEKTTFITSQGIFCYSKMLFGSKNAGATYQRLVDKAFQKQISQNLEVYVDDLVIKSRTEREVIKDIEKTFKTLREINMKLNPKKCTFWMREGTFLGYKVNAGGLKVCSDKVEAGSQLAISKVFEGRAKAKCRALQGPEINYTPMEKLILALVTGRLLKWRFELEEHNIHYRPRTSVKGQILADFIVEHPKDDPPDTPMEDKEEVLDSWILFTDGSSSIDGFGAGLIITNPEGVEFTYALRFRFDATNNEAEYEALIAGLRIAEQIGVKNLQANVDSRLMANQVNGTYIAKEPGMIKYLKKVKNLTNTLLRFK
ncbi:reverse transcriptase domain-containing protein [Tanacetum coccineum]